MKQMLISKFRFPARDKMLEVMPVVLTSDGQPFAVEGKPEDVIVIGDMHPVMKKKMKDLEGIARAGMAKPEIVTEV